MRQSDHTQLQRQDKQKKKLAETKNKASTLVYETEKMLNEHGDKLDEGSKTAVESSIQRVKEAEQGEDVAAIESAISGLEQAAQALAQHMQSAGGPEAGAAPEGQPAGATAGDDDDVIDAEFEKSE